MARSYDPQAIEAKWQKRWEEKSVYRMDLQKAKKPFYSLVMFPYPSGDKLHIGHWYSYSPADSASRYYRMQGHDVFSPIGFDAFGLPAENHAIKKGEHPDGFTDKNVATMIQQLRRIGCMYDWERMVNTSKPAYYRWTQWLFLQMYKHGLAYKKEGNVNWCPGCQTVLANEQVWDGKCERCESDVAQKPLEQWYWRITEYAQRLLDGLGGLDWPERTKTMQRNWIGRSEGVHLIQHVKDLAIEVSCYDSVPQTFMAQTFAVIAPEHPLIETFVKGTKYEKDVLAFCEKIKKKKAAKRFIAGEDMEGVFTGRYLDNPFGTGDLPIWVASFVVMEYGTGMVNSSAHDERDFAFAKKYGIPLRPVMFPKDPQEAERVKNLEYCYAKDPDAIMGQPEEFHGRGWGEARDDIIEYMVKKGWAKRAVHYRLRDWLVSRQRYWGAPIPIVYDPEGNPHPVPEEHLPWLLPTDVEFKPTGESPLKHSKEFRERTERIFGEGWTPEFDTMDTFVCSSFYYLRYLMTETGERNVPLQDLQCAIGKHQTANRKSADRTSNQFIDLALEKAWMPVNLYVGGAEHACMHLIYARFVMMALKDFGVVTHDEPFQKLFHQGTITNKGTKMSKSKGNVVSPDEFVAKHGSDVFRMYLMFMGPYAEGADWSDTGIKGMDRFALRLYRLYDEKFGGKGQGQGVTAKLHATIKKVGEDIAKFHFNTAISALMELLNALEEQASLPVEVAQTVAKLLAPLAPHLSEELWEMTGGKGFVVDQRWPDYDSKLLKTETIVIAIQVNGKLRGDITVAADARKEDIIAAAKAQENVARYLGKGPKKEIYVEGKIVSFVL
jgi:leucyl-tRNA synthetase